MFLLSGFADEIDPSIDVQIQTLQELGIHYIELRGVDGRNISELNLEETKALYEKLSQHRIRVSALGSPLGKVKLSDDFEAHLKLFDHMIQQALLLQTSYIRLFSFYEAAEEEQEVIRRLGIFLDHTPKGITLLHENEKDIYGNTISHCVELMKALGPKGLKATFDPANFIQEDQDPVEALRQLLPYVSYVHVKDALFDNHRVVPAGHGDASWPVLIQMLQDSQYQGFLSMEPHLADFAGYKALENSETSLELGSRDGKAMFTYAVQELKKLMPMGEPKG